MDGNRNVIHIPYDPPLKSIDEMDNDFILGLEIFDDGLTERVRPRIVNGEWPFLLDDDVLNADIIE